MRPLSMRRGSVDSRRHQRGHMRGGGFRQCFKIIAAFKERDDAAIGACVCYIHQFRRDPGIIRLDKIEPAEGIAAVRVETGGNDDQIGAGKSASRGRIAWSTASRNCGPASPDRRGALTIL